MIPAGQEGYSLKKWCLKQWIYSHGYTQPYVARRLGVSAKEIARTREVQRVSDKLSCRAYESKSSFSGSVFSNASNATTDL